MRTFSKPEAICLMNSFGRIRKPFLFIIDFEMKAIRLFELDKKLPDLVRFDFQNSGNSSISKGTRNDFDFRKYPISFGAYNQAFETVQQHIHAGNSFLLNLTFPTRIETNLTLQDIFNRSSAKFKILIENDFVCFSPEPFISIADQIISTFPMKGTIREDISDSEGKLMADSKEIAEHSTVVDLLRNDLSMVANHIEVKRFRYVEHLNTHDGGLLQISSEITGLLHTDYHSRLGDIVFTLLPAGSVTGAPKAKTVAIIREVEKIDRGYYTGVCGVFDGKELHSAVMIRFIENHQGKMRFRSGGGITFMSTAEKEYNELIDKVYVPIV